MPTLHLAVPEKTEALEHRLLYFIICSAFLYFFTVYLMILSINKIIWHSTTG
jgi:hypothetical protein